jgi:hypothetical protein
MTDTATPLTTEAALAAILTEIRKSNEALTHLGVTMSRAARALKRWDVDGLPVVGGEQPSASSPPNFSSESIRMMGQIDERLEGMQTPKSFDAVISASRAESDGHKHALTAVLASISPRLAAKDLRSMADALDLYGLSTRDGLPVAGLRA